MDCKQNEFSLQGERNYGQLKIIPTVTAIFLLYKISKQIIKRQIEG